MSLTLYQNPKCLQSSLLITPHSLCHPHKKPPSAIPSLSLIHLSDSSNHAPFRLIHRSPSYNGFMGLGMHILKPACTAYSGEYFDEETMNQSKQITKKLDIPYDEEDQDDDIIDIVYQVSEIENTQNTENSSKDQFWMMTKPEVLDPSVLGIKPEPPSWPEREKMLRVNFERNVNSVGIPLSIRIIKKKLQWQKNLTEAKEFFTHCSMKKSFSSMVFIIHELQNYTLQIRQNLYSDDNYNNNNMQGLVTKFRSDVDASFVWLFQKILCKTPSLMVYTMVLLANFTVFSMKNNTVLAATTRIIMEESWKVEDEDEKLWKTIVEEAYRMQEEFRSEGLDSETVKQLVAPVSVELEGDTYEEYERTEMCYREIINWEPHNSLLLSNYAQFRYLVYGDVDE